MVSTGRSEFGGGLERYVFELSTSYLIAAAEQARGSEVVMKSRIASWYLLSPRPDPRDILSYSAEIFGDTARVTAIIKRGHYQLLEALQRARPSGLTISGDGAVCNADTGECLCWVLPNTLPHYPELSHAQI